ncbi:hypothetical protein WJX81_005718, partial [Elliptochloris bilobata]
MQVDGVGRVQLARTIYNFTDTQDAYYGRLQENNWSLNTDFRGWWGIIDQPNLRTPVIGFLPPPSIYAAVVKVGFYLSFGGALAYSVGGQMPEVKNSDPGLQKLVYGAFGLPFGLAMIGKATFMALLKNWFWSYIGNLAGSLFIVFMVDETLLIHGAAAPSGLANA